MNNEDLIKQNIAKNLVYYRKINNLTQIQLAEKLSYSDKAISKWERGESVPDIFTLKKIATLFRINVDDLLKEKTKRRQFIYKNKLIVSLMSVGLVWLVATSAYMIISIVSESLSSPINNLWLVWIYATLASFIVAFIFAKIWGKRWHRFFLVSGIVLSASAIIFLHLLLANVPSSWLVWCVFGPLEILVILWYLINKKKKDIN